MMAQSRSAFAGLDHGEEGGERAALRAQPPVDRARCDPTSCWPTSSTACRSRPQHGYPLRLVVPGWYGMTSVEVADGDHRCSTEPFEGYQQAHCVPAPARRRTKSGVALGRILPRALMAPPGVPEFMTRAAHARSRSLPARRPRLVRLRRNRGRRRQRRRQAARWDRGRARPRCRLPVGVVGLELRLGGRARRARSSAVVRPTRPGTCSRSRRNGTSGATPTTRCNALPSVCGELCRRARHQRLGQDNARAWTGRGSEPHLRRAGLPQPWTGLERGQRRRAA